MKEKIIYNLKNWKTEEHNLKNWNLKNWKMIQKGPWQKLLDRTLAVLHVNFHWGNAVPLIGFDIQASKYKNVMTNDDS